MKTKSLGFIGGGRITKIILQAMTNNKAEYRAILVYDTNSVVLSKLKDRFPFIQLTDSAYLASSDNYGCT
jgi:pyrroline-5-carboxylate reductase